jgi:hypothetical protein
MNEHDLLWAILPQGLEEFFDVKSFEKTQNNFRIILVEKNTVPANLPDKYKGKNIINTVLDDIIIDDFPIRGRKGEIVLKRRSWKAEGVDKMLKRDIKLCADGTRLEKEFADFLKDFPGDPADFCQPHCPVE